jgi:hypothetical protein
MGITPWSMGDGLPTWTFQIEPDSSAFDITGLSTSDFTMVFINTVNKLATNGTGTFSNLVAASGSNPAQITYTPSAVDTATAGMFDVRIVTKQGTPSQRTFHYGIWSNEI